MSLRKLLEWFTKKSGKFLVESLKKLAELDLTYEKTTNKQMKTKPPKEVVLLVR